MASIKFLIKHFQALDCNIDHYPNLFDFEGSVNEFYEGAYCNTVNFSSSKGGMLTKLKLWTIKSGYLQKVKNHFEPGDVIIDVGCGGGVKYFGQQFNTIGADTSLGSLKIATDSYSACIKVDLLKKLPIPDASIDGIVSSFVWEHFTADQKLFMLGEFHRVLVKSGKLVFMYDVHTDNPLIKRYKSKDPALYTKEFIDVDDHVGYQTPLENEQGFESKGFTVLENQGNERTIFLEFSACHKLLKWGNMNPIVRYFLKSICVVASNKMTFPIYSLFVRVIDSVVFFAPLSWARTVITVCQKKV